MTGEVAPVALALDRIGSNPVRGPIRLRFSLAGGPPARVELLDVTGRLRARRDLSGLGPGRHTLDLDEEVEPGVYFVRIHEGPHAVAARLVVIP
jgi:hypothetical protein